jgi:outer membrane protein
MRQNLFLFPALILAAGMCSGASGLTAEENTSEITLRTCIDRALKENLNLKFTSLGVRSDLLSIVQQKSIFDPTLGFLVSQNGSRTSGAPPSSFVRSNSSAATLQYGKKLSTGGNLGFGVNSEHFDSTIEPSENYSSYLSFNLTQPLLRDFGRKVTESGIYLATFTGDMSRLDLENKAIALVFSVESGYWNLVYARRTLDVLRMSVVQAESLLSYDQNAFGVGLLPSTEVLTAKSGLMAAQRNVLDQMNTVKTAEEQLKYLLHSTAPEDLASTFVPSDSIPIPHANLDEEALFGEALKMRPDYLSNRTAIEQNKLEAVVTKNSMLPGLDLATSYRLNGTGKTIPRNVDSMNGDMYGWEVDLNLSYPLGNRFAKTAYEKSMIAIRKSRLSAEDLEQSIRIDLRTAIRTVKVNREKIDEMALEVEVNRQKLDAEVERLHNGLSTSFLVLTYQNDLTNSLNLYNKTLIDHNLSVVSLQQTTGTLLRDLGITILDRAEP